MKQLSSFMVLNVNGGDRVSYTFNSIDDNSGEVKEGNAKDSFFVVDSKVKSHIEAIRKYIRENKLTEE